MRISEPGTERTERTEFTTKERRKRRRTKDHYWSTLVTASFAQSAASTRVRRTRKRLLAFRPSRVARADGHEIHRYKPHRILSGLYLWISCPSGAGRQAGTAGRAFNCQAGHSNFVRPCARPD